MNILNPNYVGPLMKIDLAAERRSRHATTPKLPPLPEHCKLAGPGRHWSATVNPHARRWTLWPEEASRLRRLIRRRKKEQVPCRRDLRPIGFEPG